MSDCGWKAFRCIGRHTLGAPWDYAATVNTNAALVVVAELTKEGPGGGEGGTWTKPMETDIVSAKRGRTE